MACRQLVDRVTDLFEQALPARERLELDMHLAGCADCRAYVAHMRRTIALTRRLGEEPLDPRLADELLAMFRRWREERGPAAASP